MLDSKKNSLCAMWLLTALISSKRNWKNVEFQVIHTLFDSFYNNFKTDQLASAMQRFFQMSAWYAEYLISVDKAIHGIK